MNYQKAIFLTVFISSFTLLLAQKVSVGISNSRVFYICPDSTVSAMGNNYKGQLGDGSKIQRTYPVKVKGLQGITDINGLGFLALKSDGTLWQWYRNDEYNLNQIPIDNVIDISCGYSHTNVFGESDLFYLAVKNDGTVWVWGDSDSLQTGEWGYTDSIQQVPINNVVQIEAANATVIALCEDGSVWTWGNRIVNGNGVDIVGEYTYTPVKVNSLSSVVDIAAFTSICYALKSDGTIWHWGYTGGMDNDYSPVKMNISNIKSINVESWMITAINNSDSLFAFCHYNIPTEYCLPSWEYFEKIEGVSNVEFVTQSGTGGQGSTSRSFFVLTNDGEFYRWGNNDNGQLGNFTYYDIEEPELMPRPCLSVVCDTITKVWDTLVVDTFVYPGQPVSLKSSMAKADLYWWYPQDKISGDRNSQEVTVSILEDTQFEAVLMDIYGCMRKERFLLKKLCDTLTPTILDTVLNEGTTIQLNAGTGTRYNWTPNDNINCTYCQNTAASITDSITYIVTYIDPYSCERKEKFIIRVPDCDTIVPYYDKLKLDTVILPGSPVQLYSSEANSYSWIPQEGLSCSDCRNPIAQINNNMEYVVTLTDFFSCNWVERFRIKNNCDSSSLLNPFIEMDTVVNPESTIQLHSSKGFDYTWNPVVGLSCIECSNPEAYINDSITYEVTYRDNYNCFFKEKFIVKIRDCDTIVLMDNILKLDTTIHYESTFKLNAKEGQIYYSWSPKYNLTCDDCQSPTLTINESGEYIVMSYGVYQCWLSEKFIITKEIIDVVIPNVFTPDNDGINDSFEIIGLVPGTVLEVYDDRGKLRYKSTNYDGSWNGIDLNGNKLPTNNTYWYILKIPENNIYKGWVFIK